MQGKKISKRSQKEIYLQTFPLFLENFHQNKNQLYNNNGRRGCERSYFWWPLWIGGRV